VVLTSHQPVYLPWLGLFHKIALADTYCFFDVAQFLLKDWNNRNRIKTDQGAIWLTVPVLKKGYVEKAIREIEIDNSHDWRKKHWHSILFNYKAAPHFRAHADFFEDLYRRDWTRLVELNEHILRHLLEVLGIRVDFIRASERRFEGRKSDQVLDMCRTLGADAFIFGCQGRNYVIESDFARHRIAIYFQDYIHPAYPQLKGEFIPHLSVIDLLFNVGANESRRIIMEGNVSRSDLPEIQ
jgi:hypothetical protein